jgi:phage terminase large subunit
VYREVQQPNLIVSEAAKLINDLTGLDERIEFTIAPPDLWNRQKDGGKSMAEIFAQNGVGLLRANNNRIQGWMALKEMLKPLKHEKDKPALLVSKECRGLIRNIRLIQHDEKNPSDCATQPHNITHICDAIRYFAITRVIGAEVPEPIEWDDDEGLVSYEDEMTGGEMDGSYLSYGGE